MKRRICVAAVVALNVLLLAGDVLAQADPAGGQNRTKVKDVLTAVAGGSCPDKLMGALLLDQCEMQLPKMSESLRRLGAIKELRFRGTDTAPTGVEVEVYRVVFANGQMTWMAATGPNGKLSVLWSPG